MTLNSAAHFERFNLAVDPMAIADLKRRLEATRWPEPELVDDWTQGVPRAYMQELCSYWCHEYDWQRRAERLNRFDHFKGEVDGLGIHFIHQRSPHDNARPLLITHGWPGSIVEFASVIEPLVNPTAFGGAESDAFHVVAPSLPGYGFSDKPTETGWGVEKIARCWAHLMEALGYQKYLAQGGDWGSAVSVAVAAHDPAHCIGIHLNMPIVRPDPNDMGDLDAKEHQVLNALAHYADWDSGYSKQQSTRPQTLGYGLVDSPVAQLAWVVEKFFAWTDNNGHPEDAIDRDSILDNVMMYWLPATGASSARLYWESFNKTRDQLVEVAMGASLFPKEILPTSRRWASRRFRNIVYWNELDRGGHFAAFEQPGLFVEELRAFARLFRFDSSWQNR